MHRQAEIDARDGVELQTSTLFGWVEATAAKLKSLATSAYRLPHQDYARERYSQSPVQGQSGVASRYGLQIRSATPADAAGLAELMAGVGCDARVSSWAARLEAVGREQGLVLLALEWGPPSGLIELAWRAFLGGHRVAQIGTLVVGPAERRRGIGRLLLKAGAQAARSAGCDTLHLAITDQDDTLEAFARASGFDPGGRTLTRALRKTRP